MVRDSLARRERRALCDTALVLGPDAPTLCDGWDARALVSHLLVRERNPLGAAGIVVPGLSGLADRAMARTARTDFTVLVERLRHPRLTPYAVPVVDRLANSVELFVHHEDLRRGQPGWSPRDLEPGDADVLWRSLAGLGRLLARPAGVPLRVVRTDTGASTTLRRGSDPVTVTGPVPELVLFLFGRSQVSGLSLAGPDERVERLRAASLGL